MAEVRGIPIIDLIRAEEKEGRRCFSFEYYPPRTPNGVKTLKEKTLFRMNSWNPKWMDCTWGAGGVTSDLTPEICNHIQNNIGLNGNAVMHLTCTNMEVSKIDIALEKAKKFGIKNILALRGDPPKGQKEWKSIDGGFRCALDLIKYIKSKYADYFCITVAGYPEGHPLVRKQIPASDVNDDNRNKFWGLTKISQENSSDFCYEGVNEEDWKTELLYLKSKVDAGADVIITQLFYQSQIFIDFVKECRKIGIKVPIIPGIMPIKTFGLFKRMTGFCKTIIPDKLINDLLDIKKNNAEKSEEDITELIYQYGMRYVTRMCKDILDAKNEENKLIIPGIHIYTMNLERPTIELLYNLSNYFHTKENNYNLLFKTEYQIIEKEHQAKQKEIIANKKLNPKMINKYKIKDINNKDVIQKVYNFIGNKYYESFSNEWIANKNPATNKVISNIVSSNKKDIDFAVKIAQKAFKEWSKVPIAKRSEYLNKIATILEQKAKEFALLESRDNGKPLQFASLIDIPASIKIWRYYANQMFYLQNGECLTRNNMLQYTQRPPLGIVGGIAPWNYPLVLISNKIAPAIIYGNCVIVKPSELTPMTAYLLSDVIVEAGLPPGVVNIVQGYGKNAGEPIVAHPKIRAISFTGGCETGRKVAAVAALNVKKVHLELGGKNPTVICDDCDLLETVKMVARASFANQGQICIAGSRIFVQKPIKDKFLDLFVKEIKENYSPKIGDPLTNSFGALISIEHRDKIEKYIELSKKEGGQIILGGSRPTHLKEPFNSGAFYLPTIITGLKHLSRCATEEIFGPIVTIHEFEKDDDVIEMANCVEYGLSASVWTTNIKRGHRLAENIQSGMVWVNCWAPSTHNLRPFGGFKGSGNGRENGKFCYEFYTECKNIVVKY